MPISQTKLNHLKKLSNKNHQIAAAAMDQRGSLQKSIAKEKGCDKKEVTPQMMAEFKTAVTKVLTPHATAVLLDPEFGLQAAQHRAPNAGLLLAYEKSGYDQTGRGRIPLLLDNWSVAQAVGAGANAVKILLYYTPWEDPQINDKKHRWVERIGKECAQQDIPFFLEFVGYDEGERGEKTLEYAKKKPEIVTRSMAEFSKDRYQVDCLKVEVPIDMAFVKGSPWCRGEAAYDQKQALDHFRKAAAATHKPFIYLPAGVNDDVFRASLELATKAGVAWNGVLCGRATWKEGIPVYAKQGVRALEDWLLTKGVGNITALNQVIQQGAKPWTAKLAA